MCYFEGISDQELGNTPGCDLGPAEAEVGGMVYMVRSGDELRKVTEWQGFAYQATMFGISLANGPKSRAMYLPTSGITTSSRIYTRNSRGLMKIRSSAIATIVSRR